MKPSVKFASVLLFTGVVVACGTRGSEAPAAPTAPTVIPSRASSDIVSSMSGFVLDTLFAPVSGARVEIVDGLFAGTSAISDNGGEVSMPVTFGSAVTFRATKAGYATATHAFTPTPGRDARSFFAFYLSVSAPPASMAGNYTLTFVADNACADFPAALRTRTYGATIRPWLNPSLQSSIPADTILELTATRATFSGGHSTFLIGIAGNEVFFNLDNGGHSPALMEQVTSGSYLAISGSAAASVASAVSTISTAFKGLIESDNVRCESANHQLILTRQ